MLERADLLVYQIARDSEEGTVLDLEISDDDSELSVSKLTIAVGVDLFFIHKRITIDRLGTLEIVWC